MTQKEKAERLRDLHKGPPILVMPNAWDAASARIFEAAGFPAVGTTSAGVASSLGYPDGERIPLEELIFVVRRITATVRIPVTVDAEAGFGANVEQVVETARALLDAGAVGLNLEDRLPELRVRGSGLGVQDSDIPSVSRPPSPVSGLLPLNEAMERVRALRELGRLYGVPLVINARTDAFYTGLGLPNPLEEAVERANAFGEAGADCLFVPFVTDPETIRTLSQRIRGPINVLAGPGTPPVPELERMGVARVSVGSGPNRATLALVRRIAEELRGPGTYTSFLADTVPYPEVNRLFER